MSSSKSGKTPKTDNGPDGKISALIARVLELPDDLQSLDGSTHLADLGVGLDSFDAMRLIAALEKEFGVTIEETELSLDLFESIDSIASLIRAKLDLKPKRAISGRSPMQYVIAHEFDSICHRHAAKIAVVEEANRISYEQLRQPALSGATMAPTRATAKNAATNSAESGIRHCRDRIADYKIPTRIEF